MEHLQLTQNFIKLLPELNINQQLRVIDHIHELNNGEWQKAEIKIPSSIGVSDGK